MVLFLALIEEIYDNSKNFYISKRSLKYLYVFTPVLQKDLLPTFYPAEELVCLGQIWYSIFIKQVIKS